MFSGGEETNSFLRLRGFEIISKDDSALKLLPYENYSREEVHGIFAPITNFTPQSGTWGLQGFVLIPNRHGDFVFFVTFGQQQGEHIFDEGITKDGVLSWQSQPRQSLKDAQIQQWIQHDELKNSIYLFLRTNKRGKYTYLGRLKYLSHDTQREKPVYFQWQILEWNIPDETIQRMELELQPSLGEAGKPIYEEVENLKETTPPSYQAREGTVTSTFRSRKVADYSERDAKNRERGLAGELLVIEFEKQSLVSKGRADLADRIRHVSNIEGDGAGYDVESFTPDGEIKYIEVKTTKGAAESSFYMTSNEVEFAKQHEENYYIYRVYEYDKVNNKGKVYVVKGSVESAFNLTSTQYRVTRS